MQELINVLSYHASKIGVRTKDGEYLFEPSDGVTPVVIPMTMAEITYIHSVSNVFRVGFLGFEEDVREKLYTALRLPEWRDILTDSDIEDILLHPTLEKLQRIVGIQDGALFERVRGVFYRLKNNGADLSMRVEKLVTARYGELRAGKRSSAIALTSRDAEQSQSMEQMRLELERLQAEVARLGKQEKKPPAKKPAPAKQDNIAANGKRQADTAA